MLKISCCSAVSAAGLNPGVAVRIDENGTVAADAGLDKNVNAESIDPRATVAIELIPGRGMPPPPMPGTMLGLIPEVPVTIDPRLGNTDLALALTNAGLTPSALPTMADPTGNAALVAVVNKFVPMFVALLTRDPTPGRLVNPDGNAPVILLIDVGR